MGYQKVRLYNFENSYHRPFILLPSLSNSRHANLLILHAITTFNLRVMHRTPFIVRHPGVVVRFLKSGITLALNIDVVCMRMPVYL